MINVISFSLYKLIQSLTYWFVKKCTTCAENYVIASSSSYNIYEATIVEEVKCMTISHGRCILHRSSNQQVSYIYSNQRTRCN
jgi:hypothetical protein